MQTPETSAATTTPHGARILLGEDHPINQRLMTHILARDAHTVDIAHDGCQVIQAFLHQPYDLILMDVYMPELDGLAATAWIRYYESIHGGHIPIIGLTAGDMFEDRERCLQAGMEDYLPKPFKAEALLALVAQWTRTPLLDKVLLADLQGRGRAAVEDTLTLFLHQFLSSLPEQMAELQRAYHQNDRATLHRIAHNLKGTGGTFGAPRITYLCAHLEALATEEGWPAVPAWLQELELTIQRLMQQLHGETSTNAASA
jgi:hypothetical protein